MITLFILLPVFAVIAIGGLSADGHFANAAAYPCGLAV